jgi:hypothetical protein
MRTVTFGGITALVAGLLLSTPATAAADKPHAIDRDSPVRKSLPLCATKQDRDCIESLGLVTGRGFVPGEVIAAPPPQVVGPITKESGVSGPTTGTSVVGNFTWRIPGLKSESGRDTVSASFALTTPGLRWYDARADFEYDVVSQLTAHVTTGRHVAVKASPPCEGPSGECHRMELMARDQTLRVALRTSWFRPAWARSHLGQTVVQIDPLQGGGSRIVIQGYALSGPGFFFGGGRDPLPQYRDRFDFYDRMWNVYMMDANDPKLPSECARHGFPLVSGNQWGSGTPMWDSDKQELHLVVSAPHFDGRGRVFRGQYEAFIPAAYARCLWRTNPRELGNRLIVEVTAEDGEEQAVTTSIEFRNRGVRINARGFTFSSPSITVRPRDTSVVQ